MSFAPPCIDTGVEASTCTIARPDAISPSGQLQDTVSPDYALAGNELIFTATDNNCKADITSDDVVVKTETDKGCEIRNSAIHAEKPIDSFLSDGWSDLRYVEEFLLRLRCSPLYLSLIHI